MRWLDSTGGEDLGFAANLDLEIFAVLPSTSCSLQRLVHHALEVVSVGRFSDRFGDGFLL